MSDQPDEAPLPELTPEQESEVRRILADARHTDPVPADVAARLDGVLADLARENPRTTVDPTHDAPVVDLAARRRRRNAGGLLAAAAAVIVVGVGVGQAIGPDTASDDAAGSAASNEAPDRAESASAEAQPAPGAAGDAQALAQVLPLQLTRADLAAQLEAQLQALPSETRSQLAEDDATAAQGLLDDAPGFTCANVPAEQGVDLLPAYVDGRAAVVVLSPAVSGVQPAEVIDCETGEPIASASLRVP